MALFGSKKKKEEVAEKPAQKASVAPQSSLSGVVALVLQNPRITEKASVQQGASVYAFDVAPFATKTQIAAAVRSIYKVTPRKVRIVRVPTKKVRNVRTGRIGIKSGGKKAYVYLTSGESITIA